MKVLFIGCGDIGVRTIRQLECSTLNSVWQAVAMRRHPTVLPPDIHAVAGDIKDVVTLTRLLESRSFDAIVVTLTPDQITDEGYLGAYVAGAKALKAALVNSRQTPGILFWASSTGVYGQVKGEWVDESSETNPSSFRGKRLLEAEQLIQQLPLPTVVLRFSGIYGPGRNRLIKQVRAGVIAPVAPVQWTNRIHSEDCAGVLSHLLGRFGQGLPLDNLYIASDNEPVSAHAMQRWLAEQLGITAQEGDETRREGGRRCCNQRLTDSGYQFRYPTYREGYSALLANERGA